MDGAVVRLQPGRTFLSALIFIGFGGFIAKQDWNLGFYGLMAIGAGIGLLGLLCIVGAVRQAQRLERAYRS